VTTSKVKYENSKTEAFLSIGSIIKIGWIYLAISLILFVVIIVDITQLSSNLPSFLLLLKTIFDNGKKTFNTTFHAYVLLLITCGVFLICLMPFILSRYLASQTKVNTAVRLVQFIFITLILMGVATTLSTIFGIIQVKNLNAGVIILTVILRSAWSFALTFGCYLGWK
jgi:hypothetical protein